MEAPALRGKTETIVLLRLSSFSILETSRRCAVLIKQSRYSTWEHLLNRGKRREEIFPPIWPIRPGKYTIPSAATAEIRRPLPKRHFYWKLWPPCASFTLDTSFYGAAIHWTSCS